MKLRALRKNRQIICIINKQISKSKKINQIGSNTAYICLNRSGDRNCTEYADKHSIMNKGHPENSDFKLKKQLNERKISTPLITPSSIKINKSDGMIKSPTNCANFSNKIADFIQLPSKNSGINVNLYGSLKQVIHDKSKFNCTGKTKPAQYLRIDSGLTCGPSRNKYMNSTTGNMLFSTTPKDDRYGHMKSPNELMLKTCGSCKTFN